jgi:arabinan endo-1,5-alpha-L-arabinosidase
MKRSWRIVLFSGPVLALLACSAIAGSPSPREGSSTNSIVGSAISPFVRNASVHDPSTIVKCQDQFWVFYTGRGVTSWHSADLTNWIRGPAIFNVAPSWIAAAVPANRALDYWAPDVICLDGRYMLYYSASTFGKNVSGIGLVTSPTLDPADPSYHWTDQGSVIVSTAQDNFNTIDPCIFHDTNGSLWLAFGSFWSGIRLVELDPKTGKRATPNNALWALAHSDSIEAAYLYQREGYYYLFVNWGTCCRGTSSTYRICVGRSSTVTGPYLDKQGKDMLQGGGTLFLDSTPPYIGPGHAGIIEDHNRFWFSCHYEGVASSNSPGAQRGGGSRLAVLPLRWTNDHWPELDLTH